MSHKPVKVLFLCTGNSARSIMAEAILNRAGSGRFSAYSAGSRPAGVRHPAAMEKLHACGHDTEGLRSKSWDAFSGPDSPAFDYVITVCDNAASEACPVWIGSPVCAHWGVPDPAAVRGGEDAIRDAFDRAYEQLESRIHAFIDLPLDAMDDAAITKALVRIGAE